MHPKSRYTGSITFVSQHSYKNDIGKNLGLQKKILPVKNCRQIAKKDMIHNTWVPKIEVDYKTDEVRANGGIAHLCPRQRITFIATILCFLNSEMHYPHLEGDDSVRVDSSRPYRF